MGRSEIKAFEFELFKDYADLFCAVFSRAGGVSSLCFDSLNVGLNSGDEPLAVAENRRRILARTGTEQAVFLNQVHGTKIHVFTGENPQIPIVADGVVTDRQGVALMVQVADCQGVLLFDPQKKVIANVHSGWRGSVHNIIGNCIDVMVTRFQCDPVHIRAGISPSLGPCCAEFVNYKDEIPEYLWPYKLPDGPYFDFWKISRDQLMEKGVKQENIETMNICTHCSTDTFFSYRREKKTGRFACVISLKN